MTSHPCVQQTGKERFSRSATNANLCEEKSMNGYRSEHEEQSSTVGQICCLVEDGERCKRPAGNASYSKRIQKTVSQRKLKLSLDANVSEYSVYSNCSPESFCPRNFVFKLSCTFNSHERVYFDGDPFLNGFISGEAHLHLRASQKYDSKCSQQEKTQGL